MRQRRPHHEKRAAKIDIEYLVPVLDRERGRVPELAEPGGGHHQVQAAKVGCGAADRVVDRARVAHVALDCDRSPQLARGVLELMAIASDQGYASAFAGKGARRGAADST